MRRPSSRAGRRCSSARSTTDHRPDQARGAAACAEDEGMKGMSAADDANEALVAAARALAPRIRACADQAERDRDLPPPLVDAMAEAGFFRLLVPKALGGGEVDPLTLIRVIEAVSEADGSAGWCVGVGAVAG